MNFDPTVRILLLVLVVGSLLGGEFFYRYQNSGNATGGEITRAKLFWLIFAVVFWMGVCPLLAFEPSLPAPWRWTFGIFGLQFWIRGVVEGYMIFVKKNWIPPYGIGHDIFSIGLVVGLGGQALLTSNSDPANVFGTIAALVLTVSLIAEACYAILFHKMVEGRTTGDDGVWWFEDKNDPRFIRNNRITTILNIPLYTALIVGMFVVWGVG